jgi:hypothetical protein
LSKWDLGYVGVQAVFPEDWNNMVDALNELDGRAPSQRNGGIATIPNGETNIEIEHGLTATPQIVLLTGTHSEVASPFVTNVTTSHLTINVANLVTADRQVYWYAIRL